MIKIEDYKGFEIFYDEDSDKFITTMELNNVVKEPKRASLKALRQEINTFVKLNFEFKPFRFLENSPYGSANIKYATAIRSDGSFVVSSYKDGSHASYWELRKMKGNFVFDENYINTLNDFDKKIDLLRKQRESTEKELKAKLIPLDLSKYE